MREIRTATITETVSGLCRNANFRLPPDVTAAVERALSSEPEGPGREVLSQILENARLASEREVALCQDTGIAEVYLAVGQEVHVTGGGLTDAVNRGVAHGYTEGYLRKSIVTDPFDRRNTGDNTPALVYTEMVPGDRITVTVLPKGGGSENASTLRMMTPAAGWNGVKDFVLEAVRDKGGAACPPLIVGVGVGGNFSGVGRLAKKALLRAIGSPPREGYGVRERELLDAVNATGIGPMGLGGKTTALAVHIEPAPCHIASLPVAVSMQCHSCRRMTAVI